MSSNEQIKKSMLQHVKELKRLGEAKSRLKSESRQYVAEEMNYNTNVEKVYKPFVDSLDKQLVPIKQNMDQMNQELPTIKQNVQKGIEIATDLHQELDEYNTRLRDITAQTQEQLAIENIPEKYYQVIGNTAKKYLAKRDIYDSYGLRYDEETERFMIGQQEVQIDANSDLYIHLDSNRPNHIPGTEGLWKLLTQKNPYKVGEPRIKWSQAVSQNDIGYYSRIMYYTKACYKEGKNGWIKRSSSASKWNEIIKPYLEKKERERAKSTSTVEGSGLTILPDHDTALAQKLFIIVGNIKAGHTNVSNDDIHVASEILEKIKSTISSIAYNNIKGIISDYINGKNASQRNQ